MAIPKVVLRAPYNYDVDKASNESGIVNNEPSLTIQSQKDEADINVIVRRFGLTGEVPVMNRVPLPLEHCDDIDYRDCLDYVNAAGKSFDTLPSDVRARFANNPALLVDFASDPQNKDQLKLWGLLREEVPVAPAGASPAA